MEKPTSEENTQPSHDRGAEDAGRELNRPIPNVPGESPKTPDFDPDLTRPVSPPAPEASISKLGRAQDEQSQEPPAPHPGAQEPEPSQQVHSSEPADLDETRIVSTHSDLAVEPTSPQAGDPAQTSFSGAKPPALPPTTGTRKRFPWGRYSVLGLLGLLLIAAASAFSGYQSGIQLRTSAEATQAALTIQEQFELGVQEMAEENYDRARQRFEYVIQIDPNYPGVTEKLAEVLLEMNTVATPTVAPTPTLTPTPDLRGVEELFTNAQQALANNDWTTTIDTLLTLRKNDPNYRTVEADGMLYLAFRNRGKDKIGKEADLEGGIYDLSLAERFGPLDSEAQGFLSWATVYITGASFWEVDWKQAVDYFSQVAPQLPNLRDGSGLTATERYRMALIGYGDDLFQDDDPCAAVDQYSLALEMGGDAHAEEALVEANDACAGASDEGEGEGDGEEGTPSDVPLDAIPTEAGEPPAEEPPAETPLDETTPEPPAEQPTEEPPAEEPTPAA